MRIKTKPDWQNALSSIVGRLCEAPPTLFITEMKEYTVYGLSWHATSSIFGAGFVCEVADDYGNIVSVPLDIFDIVEDRVSNTWLVRRRGDSIFFWPELFFQQFFFDDLSEGEPGVVQAFRSIKKAIESE